MILFLFALFFFFVGIVSVTTASLDDEAEEHELCTDSVEHEKDVPRFSVLISTECLFISVINGVNLLILMLGFSLQLLNE